VNEVHRAAVKLSYATASSEDYHDAIPDSAASRWQILSCSCYVAWYYIAKIARIVRDRKSLSLGRWALSTLQACSHYRFRHASKLHLLQAQREIKLAVTENCINGTEERMNCLYYIAGYSRRRLDLCSSQVLSCTKERK
jgi:hypothetical protein